MDENTNQKIEELKKNPPNRILPVLLIPVAMLALFFYRVATTDPQWNAAESSAASSAPAKPMPKADPSPSNNQAPAPVAKPAAASNAPTAPAATKDNLPQDDAVAKIDAPKSNDEAKPAEEEKSNDQSEATSESDNASALDTYLAGHLGQRVPFLYKGEKRTVTIAAFTEETVTIKRKKSFTMKRSELSPEQLALWK